MCTNARDLWRSFYKHGKPISSKWLVQICSARKCRLQVSHSVFPCSTKAELFLSAAFRQNSLRYPLQQWGIITLDVDVVSWRVPTSSDGSAVLWFILNIFSLPPFPTNYFTNFTFVVACLYVRRKLKTVVQDVCSGLEEAVLQSQPGLQNFLPSLC